MNHGAVNDGMKVGIVGGGVLGLALAYYLGRSGARVTVFEGKNEPGGLLQFFPVDCAWIDKYYHCILSSDTDLLALVDEIGLGDRVRFTETKQGFYHKGKLFPVTTAKDFLLFPPFSLTERFRLGLTVLGAMRVNHWEQLEDVPVEDWLVGLGGRGTFEKLWKPLLKAKFDGNYGQTPATYIWSRLKRTSSTRTSAGQKEMMGYFVGSYKVLVDRLVERIQATGATLRLGARVQEVAVQDGRATGVVVDGSREEFDAVVVTTPLPILSRLVPEAHRTELDIPTTSEYLGVVCGLLLLDRALTPYYTLYLGDDDIPFTGLIETTSMIAPEHVGGYHLVYLPKYVTPGNPYAQLGDDELRALYAKHLRRMFPGFEESWIKHSFVFRERFVEPLHQIGKRRPIMPFQTKVPGLFVVNNGQIYPELTNCQASVQHALKALPTILGSQAAPRRVEAGVGSN
jgi:protoporphyrinogen oxidase